MNKLDPTLIGLPREIRDQIFGHLLTVDRSPEFTPDRRRWEKNIGNLGLLRVNRQIRAEAWHVLKTKNIIIDVTVVTETNQLPKPNLVQGVEDCFVQPYIQPSLFGHVKAEELRTASALHIWLGKSCGKDDINKTGRYRQHHNIMFVYSMRACGSFCDQLATTVEEYQSISIDVNPRPVAASFKFVLQELIHPLGIIRGATRVCFRGIMKIKHFANLARVMMKRIQSPQDLTKILLQFKDRGNNCYKAREYSKAICHYWMGKQAVRYFVEIAREHDRARELDWRVGSLGMNDFYRKLSRCSPPSTVYSR